jgi:NAD(P)-dependent dehydrogenase (short-subunit alcohol dehydrogenase family)
MVPATRIFWCRKMSATQLAGRMATPRETAAAALYLASDESAMVTGNTLVDSGWSRSRLL